MINVIAKSPASNIEIPESAAGLASVASIFL